MSKAFPHESLPGRSGVDTGSLQEKRPQKRMELQFGPTENGPMAMT